MLLNIIRKFDLPRADDLSAWHLNHLIIAYVLISLPMLTMLPIWLIIIVSLTVAIKVMAIRLRWQLSKLWLLPIFVVSLAMVISNAKNIGFENISVVLLFVFASLKLLEAREERDAFILMLINLLLMLGSLMAHDDPFVFSYIIFCFFYNLYIQFRIAQPSDLAISWKNNVKTLIKIFLISIPFAIGLFFLFPRINPLWRQPILMQSKTGLSDEMTPNSLSELTLDGGLAFRVKFNGKIPPNNQLYWRGPVLSSFDGKTWSRSKNQHKPKGLDVLEEKAINYTIYHDGTTGQWVLPLDFPGKNSEQTKINQDYEVTTEEFNTPKAFKLISYPVYRTPNLTDKENYYNRLLPVDIFPKTRGLANSFAKQSDNPEELAEKILSYFKENEFYYDLAAPVGNSDMDTFLFTNRSGYCEHYASTFTFMMRSQGIPARVVTGYQGGEINSISQEMEVRQYNAHAWSEIYIEDKGWVRYDPTAAIAPERVRMGSPFGSVRNSSLISSGARWENESAWFKATSVRLRAMRAFWQNWIINYDSKKQQSLWKKLGLSRWKDILWIGFIIVLMPIVMLLVMAYRYYRRKNQGDVIAKTMRPFIKNLEKMGIVKADSEPWQEFIANQQLSTAKPYAERVIMCYYCLRYQQDDISNRGIQELKLAIKQFIRKLA